MWRVWWLALLLLARAAAQAVLQRQASIVDFLDSDQPTATYELTASAHTLLERVPVAAAARAGALNLTALDYGAVTLGFAAQGQLDFVAFARVTLARLALAVAPDAALSPLRFDRFDGDLRVLFARCDFALGGAAAPPLVRLASGVARQGRAHIEFRRCSFTRHVNATGGAGAVLDIDAEALALRTPPPEGGPVLVVELVDCVVDGERGVPLVRVRGLDVGVEVIVRESGELPSSVYSGSATGVHGTAPALFQLDSGVLRLDAARFTNISLSSNYVALLAGTASLDANGAQFRDMAHGVVAVDALSADRAVNINVTDCTFQAVATSRSAALGVRGVPPHVSVEVRGSSFLDSGADGVSGTALDLEGVANVRLVGNDFLRLKSREGAVFCQNCGAVEVDDCTFRDNEARIRSGALEITGSNTAAVVVSRSRFQNNVARTSEPAAIYSQRALLVRDSTFSGNELQSSTVAGGAVCISALKTLTVENVTISGSKSMTQDVVEVESTDLLDAVRMQGLQVLDSTFDSVRASGVVTALGGGNSTLRTLVFAQQDGKLVVEDLAVVDIMLCDKTRLVDNRVLQAGLRSSSTGDSGVAVHPRGQLTLHHWSSCAAFGDHATSSGALDISGLLVLRSHGGVVGVSRALRGNGTLQLGVRGPNSEVGAVDEVNFAGAVSLDNLRVVMMLAGSVTEPVRVANLSQPGAMFGDISTTGQQAESSVENGVLTVTVTVTCDGVPGGGCGPNGVCVTQNVCECSGGYTDSASGTCDAPPTTAMGTGTTPGTTGTGGTSSTVGTTNEALVPNPEARVPDPTNEALPIDLIAIGAAGCVLLTVLLVVCACCIARKRRKKTSDVEKEVPMTPSKGASGNGVYASPSTNTTGAVDYSTLPSDSDRIKAATGREVVAVEWESDSDDS